MANRFADRDNPKETGRLDLSTTLLDIMRKEFPNDPLYSQGYLTPVQTTKLNSFVKPFNQNELTLSTRNSLNVLQLSSGSKTYAEYILDKSYPTINDIDLDDLIDEEWDFYIKTEQEAPPRPVPPTGLFLINTEIELNPVDWHDAYLQYGPGTITSRLSEEGADETTVVRNTFCVFYIENGVALPIPNYQTLEVMLVERGKTYNDIQEAAPEQIQQFDMTLDGTFEGDRTEGAPNPLEEFEFRKTLDRSIDWNYQVRFESGYRPKAPFYRDPGDYLKPAGYTGSGATDLYLSEDPRDLYFDQAFQKQTYREKMRERYEGKMIILNWPIPYDNRDGVGAGTEILSDDAVLGLRMMINGYWKQVIESDVMRTYASINNFSLNEYRRLPSGSTFTPPVAPDRAPDGRYGPRGYINLLIEAGGIEALQDDGIDSPVWNDFSHIVEADRLDITEYRQYLDNYSNGGDPFEIAYLKPYEPIGSIAYYSQDRLDALQQQALAQQQIDSIKKHIQEYWPKLAARTMALKSTLSSQPASYTELYIQKLGSNSPVYKIMTAEKAYRYVKKKRKDLKTKDERTNLLELFERNERISAGAFNRPSDADNIVGKSNWGVVYSTETGPSNGIVLASSLLFGVAGFAAVVIADAISEMGNVGSYQLPRNKAGIRKRALLNNATYIRGMITAQLIRRDNELNLSIRVADADAKIQALRIAIGTAVDFLLEIDSLLIAGDSLEDFQDIYNRMMALYADLNSINEDDLTACNKIRIDIDNVFKNQLERLYNAVQYFRQRVHDEIGNRSKFGVVWSASAQNIINQYLPGKTFDNYLPETE
jgi:hypothetical protein